jgi:hypothetical protein
MQPVPMLLMLNVHPSRLADLVVTDEMAVEPETGIQRYRDCFGNLCTRLLAAPGQIRLSADGIVKDSPSVPDIQRALVRVPDDRHAYRFPPRRILQSVPHRSRRDRMRRRRAAPQFPSQSGPAGRLTRGDMKRSCRP